MSKHDVLTEKEFAAFSPNERTIHYLELCRKKKHLEKSDINILDWGCGRGRETLWLREQGYNACGVDIDVESIENGVGLLERKGCDRSTLRLVSPEGKTDFPDGFFHYIFSNQVFEHVSDLDLVAAEMARITATGGVGYHVYPAHKYLVEGHLFMPLVHWLPKNRLRKYVIAGCVLVGQEPRWAELEGTAFREKVDAYYQYSVNETFYRKYSAIRRVFQNHGFQVRFETINHPKVVNHPLTGRMAKHQWTREILDYSLLTFKRHDLLLEKL